MALIPIIFFALLFGFGSLFSSSAVTQEAVPMPSAAASPASPSSVQLPPALARSLFRHREELPSCDTWACLQAAADRNGAELVQEETTDEGDPVTAYYRVSHRQMEVFTDHLDSWTYQTCLIPDDVRQGCTGS